MKKIGIITFHNSYNCGSMLESYAIYKRMSEIDSNAEIINFSSNGQKNLYDVFEKNTSLKSLIKNLLIFPHRKQISTNNKKYEEFKNKYFNLSREYESNDLTDDDYCVLVAGSDQIWNITIPDYDDAYFLSFSKNAKKVAYAPSFGSKNIMNYTDKPNKYKKLINNFDALSVREKNGQKWIKDLTGKNAEVLIDPTLLYDEKFYDNIIDNQCTPDYKYIFFYCPNFDRYLCKFVKKISEKYNLPVICWSSKSFYKKFIYTFGFKLPEYESPSVYLSLIKNAELVFTTSFHGTIFSTIYKKRFFTLKNGGMYGDDDRVMTLLNQLDITDRLIEPNFNAEFDYLKEMDYSNYDKNLKILQNNAQKYIQKNIEEEYEKSK